MRQLTSITYHKGSKFNTLEEFEMYKLNKELKYKDSYANDMNSLHDYIL